MVRDCRALGITCRGLEPFDASTLLARDAFEGKGAEGEWFAASMALLHAHALKLRVLIDERQEAVLRGMVADPSSGSA